MGRKNASKPTKASAAAPQGALPDGPTSKGDAPESITLNRHPDSRESEAKFCLSPGLYITATPIGNAADITLRALTVLKSCDAIVAEDTRVTAKLLAIHGISRPFLSYNDHNAPAMRPKLIGRLKEGARLALVSDAGTPLISDPGHKLVREARDAGIAVYPVPGASAILAGLTASGLPSDRFLFAGFLPVKQGARQTALMELRAVPATLVFYESARRLGETLAAMAEVFGPREAAVARELTKLHEEIRKGSLPELAEAFVGAPPKGEITLIVAPPPEETPGTERIDQVLKLALPHMPVSSAARLAAEILGAPRRETYERALAIAELPDAPDAEK